MSIVTMNMSQYEIERNDPEATGYGEEALYSGWNPALALQQQAYTSNEPTTSMPVELVTADIDAFLGKMYAYQR